MSVNFTNQFSYDIMLSKNRRWVILNSLYVFFVFGKAPIFIAAATWKEARNIAYHKHFSFVERLPEIKGIRMCSKCTNEKGILPIQSVCEYMAWWHCNCGGTSFIAIDAGDFCRCLSCGKEQRIPLTITVKTSRKEKEIE